MTFPSTEDAPSYNKMSPYEISTQETTSISAEATEDRHIVNSALLYIILLVGLPSNFSIIYLVLTVKQLRNLSNAILCLMCAGDFLVIIVLVPYELVQCHPQNITYMKLYMVFNYFICGLSIFSLTMLSFDRHKAITRPLAAEQTFKSNAIKVSIIVLLSAVVGFTNYFYVIKIGDSFYVDHWPYLVTATFLILYLLPLLVICALYTHMAITLTSERKRVGESIKRNSKIGQQRNRTALIVLSLVVLFAICWFPFFYVILVGTFRSHERESAFLSFASKWKVIFYLMNSVFDPISIYVLGSRYRHHLVRIYPISIFREACCRAKKESSNESTMQSMLTNSGSYYRPTNRINIKKEDV